MHLRVVERCVAMEAQPGTNVVWRSGIDASDDPVLLIARLGRKLRNKRFDGGIVVRRVRYEARGLVEEGRLVAEQSHLLTCVALGIEERKRAVHVVAHHRQRGHKPRDRIGRRERLADVEGDGRHDAEVYQRDPPQLKSRRQGD